jgi:hypothetical protein
MQLVQTVLAALIGAIFGATLLYGLVLCWVLAGGDFGEHTLIVTLGIALAGALGGAVAGYVLARPSGPRRPGP